ncbi:hypothetical protein JOE09_003146 [Pantoea coffeiphila]|nr:hypothetical protein [Pantoea coffeiphila]
MPGRLRSLGLAQTGCAPVRAGPRAAYAVPSLRSSALSDRPRVAYMPGRLQSQGLAQAGCAPVRAGPRAACAVPSLRSSALSDRPRRASCAAGPFAHVPVSESWLPPCVQRCGLLEREHNPPAFWLQLCLNEKTTLAYSLRMDHRPHSLCFPPFPHSLPDRGSKTFFIGYFPRSDRLAM